MKNLRLLSLITLCVLSLTFFSCKKEVSPRLKVTVVNSNNAPRNGVLVKVDARGSEPERISEEFDQEERTDNNGNAFFEFKNTVLVTIIATNGINSDTAYALLETKRTKDDENLYTKTLVIN